MLANAKLSQPEIIDLTSDSEEPPSKRQKSETPAACEGSLLKTQKSLPAQCKPNYSPEFKRNHNDVSQRESIADAPRQSVPRNGDQKLMPKVSSSHTTTNKAQVNIGTHTAQLRTSDAIHADRKLAISSPSSKIASFAFKPDSSKNALKNEVEETINAVARSKISHAEPLRFDSPRLDTLASKEVVSNGRRASIHASWKKDSKIVERIPVPAEDKQTPNASSPSRNDGANSRIPSPASPTESRMPFRLTPVPKATISPSPSGSVQVLPHSVIRRKTPVVNIPPSRARIALQKRAILDELKKDVSYIEAHPDEVHKLIGRTGFSHPYNIEQDEELYKRVAPQKVRQIDRSKILLPLLQSSQSTVAPGDGKAIRILHPREQVKSILIDRFAETFSPPLTFSNNINELRLNGKFQFVSEYVIRKGVRRKDRTPSGLGGCSCLSRSCSAACPCYQKFIDGDVGVGFNQIPTYYRRPNGLSVLRDDFIDNWSTRVEIIECSDQCRCSAQCDNRVVQRGRTVPLEIFETQKYGLAVRSLKDLVRGQFIDLYLGEIITEAELTRREEAAEEGTPSYVYSLDRFASESAALYHVDGSNFGSAMRFVNHSCNPNARTFTIMNPHGSKQLHLVGFFAVTDIPAGKEITIDYDPKADIGKLSDIDDETVARCLCGESNCRQRLWKPAKNRRPRKKLVRRNLDD